MLLTEQAMDNHIYMMEIQEILKNPQLLDEGVIESLKDWTRNKFNSFASMAISAARSKDTATIKKLGAAMPQMSLGDVNELGRKASSDFSDLKSMAVKELRQKSKNKLSGNKLEAAALVFALRAIMDKKPKQKLSQMMKATDDWDEPQQEDEVTTGDIVIWITSALLGIVATIAIAELTGILFIFGPLIFFALFAALLTAIFK